MQTRRTLLCKKDMKDQLQEPRPMSPRRSNRLLTRYGSTAMDAENITSPVALTIKAPPRKKKGRRSDRLSSQTLGIGALPFTGGVVPGDQGACAASAQDVPKTGLAYMGLTQDVYEPGAYGPRAADVSEQGRSYGPRAADVSEQGGAYGPGSADVSEPGGAYGPRSADVSEQGGAYGPGAANVSEPGGAYGPRSADVSEQGGAYGPRAADVSEPGGAFGTRVADIAERSRAYEPRAVSISELGGAHEFIVEGFSERDYAYSERGIDIPESIAGSTYHDEARMLVGSGMSPERQTFWSDLGKGTRELISPLLEKVKSPIRDAFRKSKYSQKLSFGSTKTKPIQSTILTASALRRANTAASQGISGGSATSSEIIWERPERPKPSASTEMSWVDENLIPNVYGTRILDQNEFGEGGGTLLDQAAAGPTEVYHLPMATMPAMQSFLQEAIVSNKRDGDISDQAWGNLSVPYNQGAQPVIVPCTTMSYSDADTVSMADDLSMRMSQLELSSQLVEAADVPSMPDLVGRTEQIEIRRIPRSVLQPLSKEELRNIRRDPERGPQRDVGILGWEPKPEPWRKTTEDKIREKYYYCCMCNIRHFKTKMLNILCGDYSAEGAEPKLVCPICYRKTQGAAEQPTRKIRSKPPGPQRQL